MSSKAKILGKVIAQGAVIGWWQRDDISTSQALLASASIWGDEYGYIALGKGAEWAWKNRGKAKVAGRLAGPIGAAYLASEIIRDPESAVEFVTDDYQPFVQEYIAPDVPTRPSELMQVAFEEYRAWTKPRRIKSIQSGLKKAFKNRWANPTPFSF